MQFPVNDKFVLNQDEAWYTLLIETQVPIDTVLLQVTSQQSYSIAIVFINVQCNAPVDIQDVERSTAIVSYSPPDPDVSHYIYIMLCMYSVAVEWLCMALVKYFTVFFYFVFSTAVIYQPRIVVKTPLDQN